jgi:hypothetical protein
MKLATLEPQFLRYEARDGKESWCDVARIEDAHGIEFLCPGCFEKNGGAVGTPVIVCWSRSRGTPDDARPGPGRWKMTGTAFDDLTLDADPPNSARSVQLTSGCRWHGFVTNGEVTTA